MNTLKKSIYIAGPMSGIPAFNFPAFYEKAQEYEEGGWEVFNPANKDDEAGIDAEAFKTGDHVRANDNGFDFQSAYLWDISRVIEADAIYMLKGWETSAGAVGEHAVAVAMKKHFPLYEIIYE